jgi:hypothetical protein
VCNLVLPIATILYFLLSFINEFPFCFVTCKIN